MCSSCRAFFRRSVQSGYHAIFECRLGSDCSMGQMVKRKCRFCRFQTCLRSGMRITLVLPDEERKIRFNKLHKACKTKLKAEFQAQKQLIARPFCFSFSYEEQKLLGNLASKMMSPNIGSWVQSLIMFDREVALNIIEYSYGVDDLKIGSWETCKRSMGFSFGKHILPRFSDLFELSDHDVGQIMNSSSAGIAQFFRSCQAIRIGSDTERRQDIFPKTYFTAQHVCNLNTDPTLSCTFR